MLKTIDFQKCEQKCILNVVLNEHCSYRGIIHVRCTFQSFKIRPKHICFSMYCTVNVVKILKLIRVLCCFFVKFQNIFNSLMCVLFLIILALLQFRVIQDSYLLSLCYGILVAASILCVMSMPALNKIIPIDTKEVSW